MIILRFFLFSMQCSGINQGGTAVLIPLQYLRYSKYTPINFSTAKHTSDEKHLYAIIMIYFNMYLSQCSTVSRNYAPIRPKSIEKKLDKIFSPRF